MCGKVRPHYRYVKEILCFPKSFFLWFKYKHWQQRWIISKRIQTLKWIQTIFKPLHGTQTCRVYKLCNAISVGQFRSIPFSICSASADLFMIRKRKFYGGIKYCLGNLCVSGIIKRKVTAMAPCPYIILARF